MFALAARHRRVLIVAGAALLFHCALLALPRVVRWDEPVYLLLGENLWHGRGFTFNGHPELHHSPLFPFLGGATLELGGPEAASGVWFVLCGTLLVLPVYGLARRVTGESGALLASALVATFPALTTAVLYWGTMTEPLFLLLVYGAAWLVARGLETPSPDGAPNALGPSQPLASGAATFAAAGLLLGLAYLARPEGVLWVASLGAAALLAWALRRELVWRRLLALAALPAVFAVVAAPFLLYLHRQTGEWMLSGKVAITYEIGAAVEKGDPVLYDEIINTLGPDGEIRAASPARPHGALTQQLAAAPGQASGRFLRNLGHILRSSLSSEIFSALLLLPAVWWLARPWNRQRLAAEALIAAAAAPVAAFLLFHVQQRFFAPAFPALLIWTAAGLDDLRRRLARAPGVAGPESAADLTSVTAGRSRLAWLAMLVPLLLYLAGPIW